MPYSLDSGLRRTIPGRGEKGGGGEVYRIPLFPFPFPSLAISLPLPLSLSSAPNPPCTVFAESAQMYCRFPLPAVARSTVPARGGGGGGGGCTVFADRAQMYCRVPLPAEASHSRKRVQHASPSWLESATVGEKVVRTFEKVVSTFLKLTAQTWSLSQACHVLKLTEPLTEVDKHGAQQRPPILGGSTPSHPVLVFGV